MRAADLARLRNTMAKFRGMNSTMESAKAKTTLVGANVAVMNGMQSGARAMAHVNAVMSPQKVQQTMMQFQQQSMKMDAGQEMMDDALGGDEEEDQEADEMLGSVLEEVGLEVGQSFSSVPATHVPSAAQKVTAPAPRAKVAADPELQKMLDELNM
eukprot:TRINITY_DN2028_c0_g1_i4.p1 TRINITY_DN2028_c0_g1~~TRINITY_DN2028_c0_g1_i4.p1  ORF type:complete len:156 (+),score=70.85 TRINITY_DN2028_c0_g1_i4:469-936(+)